MMADTDFDDVSGLLGFIADRNERTIIRSMSLEITRPRWEVPSMLTEIIGTFIESDGPVEPTPLKPSDFEIIEIKSKEEAIRHGRKHTGWCTGEGDNNHYETLYSKGSLYVFYRIVDSKVKRRPSYQLFISSQGLKPECRKSGNKPVCPYELAKSITDKEKSDWVLELLPEIATSNMGPVTDFRVAGFRNEVREATHTGYDHASGRDHCGYSMVDTSRNIRQAIAPFVSRYVEHIDEVSSRIAETRQHLLNQGD